MKDFVGQVRDTLEINNPMGTWHWARNILLTKGVKSVSNEDGNKLLYLVPGSVIGQIVTNYHVVYFIKNNEGIDEIGRVNTNDVVPTYETIVKTNLLNFQVNCPIEGIFVYNYKEELIISWCDGVYVNSNPPRVLNVDNLPFPVNPDKTLVNDSDFSLINLSPSVQQGDLEIQYTDFGLFGGYGVYITLSYVYNDDTVVGYFPVSDLAYVGKNNDPIKQYGLLLNFTNLDAAFSRLKIGLIIKTEDTPDTEGVLIGYESNILNYAGTTFSINLSSLDGFVESTPEAILLEKAYFSKVNTMTKYENQAFVGNVELESGSGIKFQKYANLLNVVPIEFVEEEDDWNTDDLSMESSFLPDEVYALYIELQLLNGSYTNGFHLPGRAPEVGETDDISAGDIVDYALDWANDPSIEAKNFHIFNNGVAASRARPGLGNPNPPNTDESGNKMGFWQNEEVYPNDDEYDSTVDYAGAPLGGSDLRGQPIRYHRMPSIQSMAEQTLDNNGNPISNLRDVWGMPSSTFYSRARKLGIKITNIADVIPPDILEQIQGYRISHVVRNSNNNYVVGNWVAIRRHDAGDPLDPPSGFVINPIDYEYYDFAIKTEGGDPQDFTTFQKVRVIGNELFKFRPSLSPTYIQVNYKFNLGFYLDLEEDGNIYETSAIVTDEAINVTKAERYSDCKSALIYRPSNSISEDTQYSAEGINLNLRTDFNYRSWVDNFPPGTSLGDISASTIPAYVVLNITAYSFRKDVYRGFKSNNLNIIGRTSVIQNNQIFKRADNFTDTRVNVWTRGLHRYNSPFVNARTRQMFAPIVFRGLNSPVNSSSLESDEPIEKLTMDDAILTTYDYDFDVLGLESINVIKDLLTIFTFDVDDDSTNKFPYRIYKGLKIPNENLTLQSLSTYLLEEYYDMPNDKGEIIALRGGADFLAIQMRYTLFLARIKDVLQTDNVDAYLGRGDLFDRPPKEIIGEDKGFIGSTSKFCCQIIKDMYIANNQITGQIFIIDRGVREITAIGNKNWFWNNWDTGIKSYYIAYNGERRRVDNPYLSVGHLVAYDKEYNRLIFVKKDFVFRFPNDVGVGKTYYTDGEFYYLSINNSRIEFDPAFFINKSITLSFNLEDNKWAWVCDHDYFPNLFFYSFRGLFSGVNYVNPINQCSIYEHNDKATKGYYYGQKFDSYIDIIFNQNSDITKLLHSITMITDVINSTNGNEFDKTITHIMIYNNTQCSGIINIKDGYLKVSRTANKEWNVNDFRDLVINPRNPILDENGNLITSNINLAAYWFEKSNFISKFIVARLIIDNIDNDAIYIHEVKANSIKSNR